MREQLKVYLVTGRYDFSDTEFLNRIETACRSGVTLVQLREKEVSTRRFYELAVKVKAVTDAYQIPLIINDRVDICLAVDAAGVHIGDDELPVALVRKLVGSTKIVGVSAKTVARGVEAENEGVDYLGVGAIFPTMTKDSPLTSLQTLSEIAAAVTIPVVAIGGIKEENIEQLMGTGVAGVSLVSEIMLAEQITEKVQGLMRVTERMLEAGAGMQADLKTFQARQAFGLNIVIALTAQNTYGVQDSLPIPSSFIDAQFQSLADDFKIGAAKTGMLADSERVEAVVRNLQKVDFGPLIVDPVMVAKGGHHLLEAEAVQTIKEQLLPLATVVTPNLPEAEVLLETTIKTEQEMQTAAKKLQQLGTKNIIMKGGHSTNQQAADYVLMEDGSSFWLSAPRIVTKNTHGTGDTFSACIAAELAKGTPLEAAIVIGKQFIQGAISQAISVGHGHGPTNHWA